MEYRNHKDETIVPLEAGLSSCGTDLCFPEASPVIPKNAVLRNLTLKLKYCSTYLLFLAIFERTVKPEKFCLSVRKGVSTHFVRWTGHTPFRLLSGISKHNLISSREILKKIPNYFLRIRRKSPL